MNSLSWMIYLANVIGSLSTIFAIAAILALIVVVVRVIAVFADFDSDMDDAKAEASRSMKAALKVVIPCALLAAFLPPSSTIYAIAASEYGEEILKSPTADKAVKALDAWLDRQIGEQK